MNRTRHDMTATHLIRHSGIGMNLFQHFVNIRRISLLTLLYAFLVRFRNTLLGLFRLFHWFSRYFWRHFENFKPITNDLKNKLNQGIPRTHRTELITELIEERDNAVLLYFFAQ